MNPNHQSELFTDYRYHSDARSATRAGWEGQCVEDLRLGFGTMQLTGAGVWGAPADPAGAVTLLRDAYERGVRLFDSAWYYGPGVTHRLLAEAFRPYPDDLVLLTKAGNSRGPDRSWRPVLTPAALRDACEQDLKLLGLEALPLVLLRWNPSEDDGAAFLDAVRTMAGLQREGKVVQVGLSNVRLRHIEFARAVLNVAAVSNAFSVGDQRDRDTLSACSVAGTPYYPYYPLLGGADLHRPAVEAVARESGATPAQVALAWVLAQSSVIVPVPGTRDRGHLRENVEAASLVLTGDQLVRLSRAGRGRAE